MELLRFESGVLQVTETTTINHQLNHRTIRSFKQKKLTQEQLKLLEEVVNQTPTSMFMQQRSVLHLTDPVKCSEVQKISGQSYVGASGDLFIFIVDLYRNQQIRQEAGLDDGRLHSTDIFLQGVEDTVLAVQNFVTAAESMKLGTVILGSINNDPAKLIQVLQLPRLTFPILGVQVGVANQQPQLKPRLPLNLNFFENEYPIRQKNSDLLDYDKIVETYYDLRQANRRIDSFTNQVCSAKLGNKITQRDQLQRVLHAQGLCLK
ncbi:MAG: NADPH-dependent oxidoreductase [Liquorilactobacillus nagelii]|jgi:nitroreductase|uniref:NADPH-dependent oxidoreductase n=1 Tax=Liquorilactobacillus nagelii TaxID=82688 RepID=UPI00242BC1A8|nr:NADPH-dependent oxidoreductase [Liquorilactobacillus nagelii]MCI1634531.1 NADPH-dependent oxidoreductase [Liquorilactobacillus nagelii]MCI1920446.1 NADPH-dependent oxidoreductase [Liquorilactobacillus nagelii]MCI1976090.1 NADPH-dependent oxidoreductase [Liquorilactobacillus nagelii]